MKTKKYFVIVTIVAPLMGIAIGMMITTKLLPEEPKQTTVIIKGKNLTDIADEIIKLKQSVKSQSDLIESQNEVFELYVMAEKAKELGLKQVTHGYKSEHFKTTRMKYLSGERSIIVFEQKDNVNFLQSDKFNEIIERSEGDKVFQLKFDDVSIKFNIKTKHQQDSIIFKLLPEFEKAIK